MVRIQIYNPDSFLLNQRNWRRKKNKNSEQITSNISPKPNSPLSLFFLYKFSNKTPKDRNLDDYWIEDGIHYITQSQQQQTHFKQHTQV